MVLLVAELFIEELSNKDEGNWYAADLAIEHKERKTIR